jgi:hypothetical protein
VVAGVWALVLQPAPRLHLGGRGRSCMVELCRATASSAARDQGG